MVHGWTTSPLIEYFIIDFATGEGGIWLGARRKGTVTCDGGTYDVLQGNRYDITIDGVQQIVKQFWSVRWPPKQGSETINGTISTACHFSAWKGYGMELGTTFDYQLLDIGSNYGSGSAKVTVSEG